MQRERETAFPETVAGGCLSVLAERCPRTGLARPFECPASRPPPLLRSCPQSSLKAPVVEGLGVTDHHPPPASRNNRDFSGSCYEGLLKSGSPLERTTLLANGSAGCPFAPRTNRSPPIAPVAFPQPSPLGRKGRDLLGFSLTPEGPAAGRGRGNRRQPRRPPGARRRTTIPRILQGDSPRARTGAGR